MNLCNKISYKNSIVTENKDILDLSTLRALAKRTDLNHRRHCNAREKVSYKKFAISTKHAEKINENGQSKWRSRTVNCMR